MKLVCFKLLMFMADTCHCCFISVRVFYLLFIYTITYTCVFQLLMLNIPVM